MELPQYILIFFWENYLVFITSVWFCTQFDIRMKLNDWMDTVRNTRCYPEMDKKMLLKHRRDKKKKEKKTKKKYILSTYSNLNSSWFPTHYQLIPNPFQAHPQPIFEPIPNRLFSSFPFLLNPSSLSYTTLYTMLLISNAIYFVVVNILFMQSYLFVLYKTLSVHRKTEGLSKLQKYPYFVYSKSHTKITEFTYVIYCWYIIAHIHGLMFIY